MPYSVTSLLLITFVLQNRAQPALQRASQTRDPMSATHLVLEALDVQHQHIRESVDPQMLGGAGLVLALLAVERLLAL